MNKHQCEPNAVRMLQDAGRASQQARNVRGQKPWLAHKMSDDKSEKTQLLKISNQSRIPPLPQFPIHPKLASGTDRRYPQKEGRSIQTHPRIQRLQEAEKRSITLASIEALWSRGAQGTFGCTDEDLGVADRHRQNMSGEPSPDLRYPLSPTSSIHPQELLPAIGQTPTPNEKIHLVLATYRMRPEEIDLIPTTTRSPQELLLAIGQTLTPNDKKISSKASPAWNVMIL
ncbi:MAG: hypothetical protein LQ339_006269 [Xanthoria mediterranea]|nr:MAG: hypothetical protein LQ339_006269 [Xanthoria mediterranea]